MTQSALAATLVVLAVAGCSAVPPAQAPEQARGRIPVPVAARAQNAMCLAQLGARDARYAPLPDRYYGAGCSALGAVILTDLAGDRGRFALTNLGPVSCPLANSLAGWAQYGVDRSAREILGSALLRIETMGSYSCRTVAGTSRLSAHARAEAIDIAGFVLADGRRISVEGGWNASSAERRFLRTIFASACKRFGTVLGPDYNAAHRNHLHLEAGGGGMCR